MPKEKQVSTGIGLRIRQWRKMAHIKGYELAKIIKISQGSLSDIENNKSDPSAHTIVKLLTLTDIDWVWVLTGKSGEILEGTKPGQIEPSMVITVSPGMEFIVKGRQ